MSLPTITVVTDVHHGGTAFDGLPFDAMRVVLDSEFVVRIRELSKAVTELGVYKIVEFDYRPVPMKNDEDSDQACTGEPLIEAEDVRTECDCMNVTATDVFWSGYVKHTDMRWETTSIPIAMLDVANQTLDLRE